MGKSRWKRRAKKPVVKVTIRPHDKKAPWEKPLWPGTRHPQHRTIR